MSNLRYRSIAFIGAMAFACAVSLNAQNPESFTEEQMRDFLLNAKVVNSKRMNKGITRPYQLTLSNGTLVHDAEFQPVDEYKPVMQFDNGKTEINFRDSYKYNIAAFELAKLVGLSDLMPVTVERKWEGKTGALSWWLPVKMEEKKRRRSHLNPPDAAAWYNQMDKIKAFIQLVYNTDWNQENVLISEDWHLWMIDFTRSFRLFTTLEEPKSLSRCDRQLLQKLRKLDAAELEQKTKNWLNIDEIKAVMARRDKIVVLFEDLIAKKGEKAVLYD
jgi:hypothetical protein